MSTVTIELPLHKDQTAFNLRRWSELSGDSEVARELRRFQGRIETDRHGHIIMSPPAGLPHGRYQFKIANLLDKLLPSGEAIVGCPISTADGVRAADVVWISRERLARNGANLLLTKAPEICMEVSSPENTPREMAEKRALYFAAGAKEAWICDLRGVMSFFARGTTKQIVTSRLCPQFPARVLLA
jgi:Uma2 family endonuclease